MSTAARSLNTGEADAKISPNRVTSDYGVDGSSRERAENGEYFTELKYRSLENIASAKLAKGLGAFSIALGLAEVLMPAQLGEAAGLGNRYRAFLPVLGAREIAHGVGILTSAKPTTAVWTRVGGDAVDLAFLGAAFMSPENNKRRLVGATLAILGVGLVDLVCAKKLSGKTWSDSEGNPLAPTTVGQTSGRRAANA